MQSDAVADAEVSAREVDDVKLAVLEHFALLNAGDVDARAKHYLPDATGFALTGGPLVAGGFKAERAKAAAEAGQKFNLECGDLEVTIFGNTAIATFYLYGTITPPNGPPRVVAARSSSVRIKEGGLWKIAHTHGSPMIPAALQ